MSGPSTSSGQPITGTCDGCNRPDGILHTHRQEFLCVRCSERLERYDMAHVNLEELVGPIFKAWRDFWSKRGLDPVEAEEIQKAVGDRAIPAWDYRGPVRRKEL